jgi:hypothetical protein
MPASIDRTAAAVAASLALAVAGCGGPRVEYAPVSGTVTCDGKALAGVEVSFYPSVPSGTPAPPYSTGRTDEAGRYTLTSTSGQPGAAVGKHLITVNWPYPERDPDKPPPKPPSPAIQVRYTVATRSPLNAEVKPGGPQTVDLTVEKQ